MAYKPNRLLRAITQGIRDEFLEGGITRARMASALQDIADNAGKSAHASTFADARKKLAAGDFEGVSHVHIESHTAFGDGGGGVFDVYPIGDYVDDDGRYLVAGTSALIRRCSQRVIDLSEYGVNPNNAGNVDYHAAFNSAKAYLGAAGGVITWTGKLGTSETLVVDAPLTLKGAGSTNLRDITSASEIVKLAGMTSEALRVTVVSSLEDFAVRGRTGDASEGIVVQANSTRLTRVSSWSNDLDGIRIGKAGTNTNTCHLINCVTSFNGRDGIHNSLNSGSDSNAICFDHCTAQWNGRHGIYDRHWANTYDHCLLEANTGFGRYLDAQGGLVGGHLILGGDSEANVAGNEYIHPDCLRSRHETPWYTETHYSLPLTDNCDVSVFRHWASQATSATAYTNFAAPVAHEIVVYLNSKTTLRHCRTLQLAGGVDVTGVDYANQTAQNITLRRMYVGTDKVWVEIARSFPVRTDVDDAEAARISPAPPSIELMFRGSLDNNGRAGGQLQLVSAPVLSMGALEFDGADDAGYIELPFAYPSFVAAFRARFDEAGQLVGVGQSMPGKTTGLKGYGVTRGATYFGLSIIGVGVTDSSLAVDGLWHTFVIVKTTTGATLYIDGAAVTASVAGGTMGTAITVGAEYDSSFTNFTDGAISRLVLYPGTLTTTQRQSLEDWVENSTGSGGAYPGVYTHQPSDLRMGYKATYGSTVACGTSPLDVAVTPDGLYALVTNYDSADVTKVTLSNGATSTISIGEHPSGIAVSPDGMWAVVANRSSAAAKLILLSTDATEDFVIGNETVDVDYDPRGVYAYFCSVTSTNIWRVNVNARTKTALAVHNSYGLRVKPDGSELWVTNYGGNLVTVVDLATYTVKGTIPTGVGPVGVAFSQNGSLAVVANNTAGTATLIDTATYAPIRTVTVGTNPHDVAVSPDGQIFVTLTTESNVARINHTTLAVDKIASLAVSKGLAFSVDGSKLYATGGTAGKLAVFSR